MQWHQFTCITNTSVRVTSFTLMYFPKCSKFTQELGLQQLSVGVGAGALGELGDSMDVSVRNIQSD